MTTVASWNVGDGLDDTKLHGLVRLYRSGASVIGLQEAGDRERVIDRFCDRLGWRAWFGDPDEDGASSTPILWNPRLVHVNHLGTRPATPPTNTGRLGAGPDVVKAKVWNHVRVQGDGDPFVFINGHLPASLYLPRRRALAKKQVAVLVDMIERRDNQVDVVVVGDFNSRPNALVNRPLRKLGMTQHTRQPTHGHRCIDHTWTTRGLRAHTTVINVPSDHRAALLTIKDNR